MHFAEAYEVGGISRSLDYIIILLKENLDMRNMKASELLKPGAESAVN
jgi:hypothetical protein